jgi:hypothetical protein
MKNFVFVVLSLLLVATPWTGSGQSATAFEWSRGRSTIALVFIHGLGGCAVPRSEKAENHCPKGAVDSFRNSDTGWPEIVESDASVLLEKALAGNPLTDFRMQDLGLVGIDYSQSTASGCPNFSIYELTNVIQTVLFNSNILKRYEQFIIVAHSMGGIIELSNLW